MAKVPLLTDYVEMIIDLFDQFRQNCIAQDEVKRGRFFTYDGKSFIIFFMFMQYRHIVAFQSQWRWLHKHPEVVEMLGWEQIPVRTTIARRYKGLYELLQAFVLFIAQIRQGWLNSWSRAIWLKTRVCSKPAARSGMRGCAKQVRFQPSCAT